MTITNPYYEFTPSFVPNTKARSDEVNTQYQAIQNAFDLFPGAADAITTDTSVFAPESGSGNSYVVTMPDTRTSNQDGDGIRFFATHTNTGATTLDVDGLGAVALVNWDGTVLTGSEIVSGRIYEVRFDATGSQFVLAATTDAALQVTFAEEWATKPEDVLISVAAGGDGATDFSSFHWAQKSIAGASAGIINTDIVTATPPTTELVTGALEIWDLDTTDLLAQYGFTGSNSLRIKNFMRAGAVFIQAVGSGGATRTMFVGDPDGRTDLYNVGVLKATTDVDGFIIRADILTASPPTTEAVRAMYRLFDQNATDELGFIGYSGNNTLRLFNRMHGGLIEFTGEDDAGVSHTVFSGDPDGRASLFYDGDLRFQADVGGLVRLLANIDTANPPTTEAITARVTVYDAQNSNQLGYMGFAGNSIIKIANLMHGGPIELVGQNDAGANATVFLGDPDNQAQIYFANIAKLATTTDGVNINNVISMGEIAAAPGDTPARGQFWVRDDGPNTPMFTDDTGQDFDLSAFGAPGKVNTDINTATPPTTEAVSGEFGISDLADDDQLARFGYVGSNLLRIDNLMRAGNIQMTALNAAGIEQILLTLNPVTQQIVVPLVNDATSPSLAFGDGNSGFYESADNNLVVSIAAAGRFQFNAENFEAINANGARIIRGAGNIASPTIIPNRNRATTGISADTGFLSVIVAGSSVFLVQAASIAVRSVGSLDNELRLLRFQHSNSTVRALLGHESSDVFAMRNQIHGGHIVISAENAAGTPRVILEADPDSTTTLRSITSVAIKIGSGVGEFVLNSNLNSSVDLYWDNILKFRTANQLAAGAASGAEVLDAGSIFRYVGFNELPRQVISGGNLTLDQVHQGKVLFYNEGTNRDLVLNDDSDIPVDAFFAYTVGPSASTLTGNAGTGVTITYWNGLSWTVTAAAGSMTIGEGSGTIWKESDTNYYISGPNLST